MNHYLIQLFKELLQAKDSPRETSSNYSYVYLKIPSSGKRWHIHSSNNSRSSESAFSWSRHPSR